jgi:hypothetical protein
VAAERSPAELETPARHTTARPRLRFLRAGAKRVPGAHAAYDAAIRGRHESRAVAYAVRSWLAYRLPGRRDAGERLSTQASLGAPVPLAASLDAVSDALREAGVRHDRWDGGLAAPPQDALNAVLAATGAPYPPTAGLRVVAFAPEGDRTAIDAARGAVVAGGLLHARGIGPRIHDLITPGTAPDERARPACAAFVVEDAGADEAGADERTRLVAALRAIVDAGELVPVDERWTEPSSFRSGPEGPASFVAFEALREPAPRAYVRSLLEQGAREDLHFGRELALRGGRYLYQSVPSIGAAGRRDSLGRWRVISAALAACGMRTDGRLVLDIGCNAGMMLGAALGDGAAWGLGWDRPAVVPHARELLSGMGYTRFDLTGADLGPGYPLLADVPERLTPLLGGSIVLYLAVHHHIGFARALGAFDWSVMVFEGAETDAVDTLEQTLAPLRELCDFEVAWAQDFRDSETDARPVAILRRL